LAHILLGEPFIRAIVRPTSSDEDRFLAALVENDLREDLSFREYIAALRRILMDYRDRHHVEPTLEQIAALVHRSLGYLSICRRLALDEGLYKKVIDGKITSYAQARKHLAKKDNAELQRERGKGGTPKRYANLGRVTHGRAIAYIGERLYGPDWMQEFAGVDWNDLHAAEEAWKTILMRVTDAIETQGK
jgi:hypothetical protein